MNIEVREEPVSVLPDYADIPIAFEVHEVFDVTAVPDGDGRFALVSRRLPISFIKDYDEATGEGPMEWPRRFNVSNWVLVLAVIERQSLMGAETQNINVPACRFYAQQGCVLRKVHRGVYPGLPDEIQLPWYKSLGRDV